MVVIVAAQRVFSCTEAAGSQPEGETRPSHDSFTQLLARQPPDTGALWAEAEGLVRVEGGLLIHDDSTIDKPYAKKMELVTRYCSGKHQRVVLGINLSTLLWTDGEALVAVAHSRGYRPDYAYFDSWYSSLDNLKALRVLVYPGSRA